VSDRELAQPDVLPEDVGYRCRRIAADDSVAVHFVDQDGNHHGKIIASDLPDVDEEGVVLVVEAMCHALNAGVDSHTLMVALSALYDFSLDKAFPLPGWSPLGLVKTMRVRYVYQDVDTRECLVVAPDQKTEIVEYE
jgi:hypothetical protein